MDAKITAFLVDMRRRGVRTGAYAPPAWRVAWWLGIPVPPIFFWPIWGLALFLGWAFGASVFVITALVEPLRAQPLQLWQLAALDAAAGLAFGLIAAGLVRLRARRLGLPREWVDYVSGT